MDQKILLEALLSYIVHLLSMVNAFVGWQYTTMSDISCAIPWVLCNLFILSCYSKIIKNKTHTHSFYTYLFLCYRFCFIACFIDGVLPRLKVFKCLSRYLKARVTNGCVWRNLEHINLCSRLLTIGEIVI